MCVQNHNPINVLSAFEQPLAAMPDRYSETIMDHFLDPRNKGPMDNPSGTGVSGAPGRGPYLVFQIRINHGVITEGRFQCHNCGVTVASGSVLTEMVEGKPPAECRSITVEQLSEELDGVPPDKLHVPEFALSALQMALDEADA